MSDMADEPEEHDERRYSPGSAEPSEREGFSSSPEDWEEEEEEEEAWEADEEEDERLRGLRGLRPEEYGNDWRSPDEAGEGGRWESRPGEADAPQLEQAGQAQERQPPEDEAGEGPKMAAERPVGERHGPPARDEAQAPLQASEESMPTMEERERELLRRVLKIAKRNPPLDGRLLVALLCAAERKGGAAGSRAKALREQLAERGEQLELSYRRNFPNPATGFRFVYEMVTGREEPAVASVEWAWEDEGAAIGVEVKIAAPAQMRRNGLKRCAKAIRRLEVPLRGVILLTPEQPPPGQCPDSGMPEWLGVLLWSEVERDLRRIAPQHGEDAAAWQSTIDEILRLAAERPAPRRPPVDPSGPPPDPSRAAAPLPASAS